MTALPRVAARWLARQARNDLLTLDKAIAEFGRPPRSVYDRADPAPFRWSTPAPSFEGKPLVPWRVTDKDTAHKLLRKLTPYSDLYVDFWSDKYRGKLQLWVGFRDNRDKEAHSARLEELAQAIGGAGWPVRSMDRGGRVGHLLLVDDLTKDSWQKAVR